MCTVCSNEFIGKSVIFIVDIGMCTGRIAEGCKYMHKEKRAMGGNLENKASLPFKSGKRLKHRKWLSISLFVPFIGLQYLDWYYSLSLYPRALGWPTLPIELQPSSLFIYLFVLLLLKNVNIFVKLYIKTEEIS